MIRGADNYARMRYGPNGAGSEIVATYKTELAAQIAQRKRGEYVAHRKPCGNFESLTEARDRREKAPSVAVSP